eukprot:scaffold600_cov279-Pinguiococcus_pyrenoidosus.AAC.9
MAVEAHEAGLQFNLQAFKVLQDAPRAQAGIYAQLIDHKIGRARVDLDGVVDHCSTLGDGVCIRIVHAGKVRLSRGRWTPREDAQLPNEATGALLNEGEPRDAESVVKGFRCLLVGLRTIARRPARAPGPVAVGIHVEQEKDVPGEAAKHAMRGQQHFADVRARAENVDDAHTDVVQARQPFLGLAGVALIDEGENLREGNVQLLFVSHAQKQVVRLEEGKTEGHRLSGEKVHANTRWIGIPPCCTEESRRTREQAAPSHGSSRSGGRARCGFEDCR